MCEYTLLSGCSVSGGSVRAPGERSHPERRPRDVHMLVEVLGVKGAFRRRTLGWEGSLGSEHTGGG